MTSSSTVVRLRANAFGLISVFISTWLLPVPSVFSAIRRLSDDGENDRDWGVAKVICVFELCIVAVLSANLLLALYALRYPAKPLPSSPVKKQGQAQRPVGILSPVSAKKPFSILSPNSTPTSKPKLFSYSPGQSRTPHLHYPPSPVSSPSRVIRYTVPPVENASVSSSTSTMPPTPSPSRTLASAYRGKHAVGFNGGRPMDGLFLSQMGSGEDDIE